MSNVRTLGDVVLLIRRLGKKKDVLFLEYYKCPCYYTTRQMLRWEERTWCFACYFDENLQNWSFLKRKTWQPPFLYLWAFPTQHLEVWSVSASKQSSLHGHSESTQGPCLVRGFLDRGLDLVPWLQTPWVFPVGCDLLLRMKRFNRERTEGLGL